MECVESIVEVKVTGVRIDKDFTIDEKLYDDTVTDINCFRDKEKDCVVDVYAKITSNDKNRNYIIAEGFKDFILSLFSVFGVRVRIANWGITTGNDYLRGEVEVSPPPFLVTGDEIKDQVQKIKDNFFNNDMEGFFYNLKEAHSKAGTVHRFRSLFSILDRLSPKSGEYIDYNILKVTFSDEMKKLYTGSKFLCRYKMIVDMLENSDLKDNYGHEYSTYLHNSRERLALDEFIDNNVAYNILKCIQVVRNRLNHGNFESINTGLIEGAHELLLPLVQRLIREKTTLSDS